MNPDQIEAYLLAVEKYLRAVHADLEHTPIGDNGAIEPPRLDDFR